MRQQEYLELLTEQLRCKKARGMVEEEIRSHIEEQKCAYIEDGMDEEDAEEEAVRQMGDPVETGIELNRIHKPQMAWDMIALVIFLSGVGLLIQYLLSVHFENSSFMPSPAKAVLYFVLGIAVMLGICMIDYSRIGKWAKVLYLVLTGMDIFCLLSEGIGYVGKIELLGMQLNALLLLFVPLYGAILHSYRGQGYQAVGKAILWASPVFLITLLSVNISMMIVMLLSLGVTLAIAVYKRWFQVSRKLILSSLGGFAIIVPVTIACAINFFGTEYQKMRVASWMHPFQVDQEHAYGRFTLDFVANNQWIGRNHLLNAEEWSSKLPGGNDYMLAYIASYYGILAAVVIVGLMIILFLRCMHISLLQRNQLGMIMGSGCVVVLFVQFAFYVLCNVGFLPSAIYCPFITYGGGGMITTCVLFGILLSVYRYQNVLGEIRSQKKIKITFKVEEQKYD